MNKLLFFIIFISTPCFAQAPQRNSTEYSSQNNVYKAPTHIKGSVPQIGPYFSFAATLGGTAVAIGGTASVVLRGKVPVSADFSFGFLKTIAATLSWYSIQGAHSLVISAGVISTPWENEVKIIPTMGAGYRYWPVTSHFFLKLAVYLMKVDLSLNSSGDLTYLPWPELSIGFIW